MIVVASATAEVEAKRELDARNWTKPRYQFRPDKRRVRVVRLHAPSCTIIRHNSQQHAIDGPKSGNFIYLQKV